MRVQKYKSQQTEDESQLDDYVVKIKRGREEKERRNNLKRDQFRSRPWYGTRLGLLVGLGFGLTSELINVYLIPEINLSSPPLGSLGNFIMYGFLGAFIGRLISLPEKRISGVVIGYFAGFIFVEARSWVLPWGIPIPQMIIQPDSLLFALVSFIFISLVIIPLMLLWRSAIEKLFILQSESWLSWTRIRPSLLLIVVSLLMGGFFIYPSDTRMILQTMDNLVKSGLLASHDSQLPAPLKTGSTREILQYKEKKYFLELAAPVGVVNETSLHSVFGMTGDSGMVSVAAYFQGGWTLICTYNSPIIRPDCRAEKK